MSNQDLKGPQTPHQLDLRKSASEPVDPRGEHQTQADKEAQEPEAPQPNKVILGEALAALRTLRGLTQQQLATLVGTSKAMISHLERGRLSPKFIAVQSLLRAMRFSLADLEAALQMITNPEMAPSVPRRPLELALNLDFAAIADSIGKAVTDWLLSSPTDAAANLKARRRRRRTTPPPRDSHRNREDRRQDQDRQGTA
jgi:transcriptional regulator with XRE-family HTH domain